MADPSSPPKGPMKGDMEYFRDWESDAFGLGYGTGEYHVIPALRAFLSAVPETGAYDYVKLEKACGGAVAWLLINALGHADVIEYGTSPRFGWLQPWGKALRAFVTSRSADDLLLCIQGDDDYIGCSPQYCNCYDGDHKMHDVCPNPFWNPTRTAPKAKS